MDSQTIKNTYDEQGFCLIENYFSDAEIDQINSAIDDLIHNHEVTPQNSLVLNNHLDAEDYERLDNAKHVAYHLDELEDGSVIHRSINNLVYSEGFIKDLICSDKVLNFIEALTGPDIHAFNTRCFIKPKKGVGTKWHRDIEFFDAQPNPIINCLIFLEDQTIENGCLKVVPGSHKKQLRGELNIEKEFGFEPDSPFCTLPNEKFCVCPKGTIIAVDHFTLHGSNHNQSDNSRRLLSLGYAGPNVTLTDGTPCPGMPVRGCELTTA